MNWFRTHIRATAWLALFALAVQFTLAFGHHHHADDVRIVAAANAQGHVAYRYDPGQAAPNDADSLCAICATMNLARTLVVPTPPALVQPVPRITARLTYQLAAAVVGPAHRPFQARAPPV
jgi:hypothetical protein